MKILFLKEDSDKYDLLYEICDFCSEKIESDNLRIVHIFTSKSQIAPGHKVEVDICEKCFFEKIFKELNYRTLE